MVMAVLRMWRNSSAPPVVDGLVLILLPRIVMMSLLPFLQHHATPNCLKRYGKLPWCVTSSSMSRRRIMIYCIKQFTVSMVIGRRVSHSSPQNISLLHSIYSLHGFIGGDLILRYTLRCEYGEPIIIYWDSFWVDPPILFSCLLHSSC